MHHPKTRVGIAGSGTKPKNSPTKTTDNRWQQAPTSEVARLQEELKKTKNQLRESELCTKQAHKEAEQAKEELATMTAKFEELWACEESRIQELRKNSQDRDRAWESELNAVQKHLATAIDENRKLNTRLQKAAESEVARTKQVELAHEVEELKIKLNESKESELFALEQLQLVKASMGSALVENEERESELRRLKVQMEQWRKAAEVAAAIVLGDVGGGGKFVESSKSFAFNGIGEMTNSTCSEEVEDESSIKKRNNMLKKFGVLLKKGQK